MHKYYYFITLTIVLVNSIAQAHDLGEKILVTGGAGFIGSHVVEELLKRGDRVIIIDNLCDYYNPALKKLNLERVLKLDPNKRLTCYQEDITDMQALTKIFESERPTKICHLAAYAGVSPSIRSPEKYIKNNILGTFNLLEMAKIFGIKHFVLASSSSVYGDTTQAPFEETSIVDKPCSPYAATKSACELIAYTYHHLYNFSCSCLRFFTVYGPHGRPDMAPFKFMNAIYNGEPIMQFGDGSSLRDFTYIDDIVDGVLRALDKPFAFEIFNLGRGEPVRLKDFIKEIEKVVKKKAIIIKKENQAGDVQTTHASIKKAQEMLGFKPKVSLSKGLQLMYKWYVEEYLLIKQNKSL